MTRLHPSKPGHFASAAALTSRIAIGGLDRTYTLSARVGYIFFALTVGGLIEGALSGMRG
jgi:hypothetical protein